MDLHLHLKQAQKEMGLTHEQKEIIKTFSDDEYSEFVSAHTHVYGTQKEAMEIYGYDIYGEVTQLA